MKGTAGVLKDGIRIQSGISNVETCCVRYWKLFRGSKFDVQSSMIYFMKKWMENG